MQLCKKGKKKKNHQFRNKQDINADVTSNFAATSQGSEAAKPSKLPQEEKIEYFKCERLTHKKKRKEERKKTIIVGDLNST